MNENSTQNENYSFNFSGRLIAKNTVYNLLGYVIPIVFALFFIPPLIEGLGKERFGILSLVWVIIGYFSFLDLGIGRSLTKVISEKIGRETDNQIPIIFWTALIIMFTVSIIISLLAILFIPSLLNNFLNISEELKPETYLTFLAITLAIPLVSTTAALRGVLEAYQKFLIINLMRTILGIFTFLGPILVLILTNSLLYIVLFLIFIRVIIWLSYFIICLNIDRRLRKKISFSFEIIKPTIRFSIWISLSNIISPIILYSDRFLIGSLVSASAITYYATPYEMVTKILLIPGALLGVLFPVFSASFIDKPELAKKFFIRGLKFVFIIIYPVILVVIIFSKEILYLWLGRDFSNHSTTILQYLSIGIFMNSLSMVPNIFFQGTGKPKIPTLINFFELPFYILTMWFTIKTWNIEGAAFTYMIMASIDVFLMYMLAAKVFIFKLEGYLKYLAVFPLIIFMFFPFIINDLLIKIVFVTIILTTYIFISIRYILSIEEKELIKDRIRILF